MIFLRRRLPLLITMITGLLFAGQYYVPHPSSEFLLTSATKWLQIIGGFALVLGVSSLFHQHAVKIRRQEAEPHARSQQLVVVDDARELAGLLDLRATTGRSFAASDFANGAAPVALLTDRFWRRRFGGDAGVIGRSIDIGSDRTQIVGVLPPAANHFPASGSDVWVPLTFSADSFLNQRGSIALSAIGRLRTGQSSPTCTRARS